MGRAGFVGAVALCLALSSCATAGEEGSEESGGPSAFSGFLDGMISLLGAILSGLGG